MNISTKLEQTHIHTDIENRCVVVKEKWGWGGMDWEFRISIYKHI